MPKVVIDDTKGLVQQTGTGIEVKSTGLVGLAYSSSTSLIRNGVGIAGALEVKLPAGALVLDAGIVVTTAIAISGNSDVSVKVGTAANGSEIAVAANLISAFTASAAGKAISLDASGEGAATLAMSANAVMHSSTERTIHITVTNSANNITAGACKGFVRYAVVK